MEQKLCKNNKCNKPLPEGYKHKYCENCRNKQANQFRNAMKATLGAFVMIGGAVITIATKGKINVGKK